METSKPAPLIFSIRTWLTQPIRIILLEYRAIILQRTLLLVGDAANEPNDKESIDLYLDSYKEPVGPFGSLCGMRIRAFW